MLSRPWSGCQLRMATARAPPDAPDARDATAAPDASDNEAAPLARLRSVTVNVPGVAAVSVCRPAPRLSAPPGAHSRTGSGRYWLREPNVPLTDVWYARPSTVRPGPCPQAKPKLSFGVTARRPARAGTESCDSRTGSV